MFIDSDLAAAAVCDDRGVPRVGRVEEFAALHRAGYRDLSFGRLYEGHINALQLIARCGTADQRRRAETLAPTTLYGVWNTEDRDALFIDEVDGRYVLRGAKTWCSGAGTITRPIVTARNADGYSQMCVVPIDRVRVAIDSSDWHPLGMQGSDSFRVVFDGVTLDEDDLLGHPDAYEMNPWFLGGAVRFVAVQAGGIERLVDETARYLIDAARDGDILQTTRFAEMRIALGGAKNWLDYNALAWTAFDRDPSAATAEQATLAADMARAAVERSARDVIERAQRCVGARGLLEPLPFAALCRDLEMYLRQPGPDAALVRVGREAFAQIARRSDSVAHSTGTLG